MKKILLASYILYLPFQLKLPQLLAINLVNLFLGLLLILFIFSQKEKFIKPKFELPLTIFLIIWFMSFLHTLFSGVAVWQWEITQEFKRLFTLVLGYFVFSRCVTNKENLHFFVFVLMVSIVLVGFYTWRGGMLAGPHFADFKRSSGPFALGWKGSDIAGGFLATFTPFILSFAFLSKNKLFKTGGFVGLIGCVMGLLATYSRGSMLALATGILVTTLVIVRHFFKTSKISALMLFIAFVVLIVKWQSWVPESIIHRVDTTVEDQGYEGSASLDPSSQKRINIWSAGLEVFSKSPLTGAGFKRPQYELGVDTHNAFILIAAEAGIFAFLAVLWFIWKIFRESFVLINSEFNVLGIGFIGCMTSFLFVNMFYSNFFRDTVVGTFWIALGLLAASKKFVTTTTQYAGAKKNARLK